MGGTKTVMRIMTRIRFCVTSAGLLSLALAGCSSKEESAATTATNQATAQEAGAPSAGQSPAAAISAAQSSLKAGNVDEAAAKLAQLQIQGASFNAQQAKDYRQTLSEAYDRAFEAAQRGDPRAQAALQLLRAAAPR